MKILYTLLFGGLLISNMVFSQTSVEIIAEDDGQNYAGQVVEISGDGFEINKMFYVKNTGSTNVFYWGRTVVDQSEESFLIQLCDENICYNTTGEFWVGPKKIIEPGVLMDFKPQLSPNGKSGTAEVVYYVLDEQKEKIDSLTVRFTSTSTAAIEKQETVSFTVFPNPVQNVLTIKSKGLENGGMAIFNDALGKEIKQITLVGSTDKIDVSDLKRGVYFVSLYNKEGVKSTTQRIVKN